MAAVRRGSQIFDDKGLVRPSGEAAPSVLLRIRTNAERSVRIYLESMQSYLPLVTSQLAF